MKHNYLYEYPTLRRVTQPSGIRHYECPVTGMMMPSVTTILSATSDKKDALREWEEWVGKDKADNVRKEATDLGSLMHLHIENFVAGIERPKGNNLIRLMARKMADQIIENLLSDVSEVWGQEVALYYPELFAGTTDLVGIYKGKQAIMDHKSAKKLRSEKEIVDYFDQMAAYALAHDYHYKTDIEMAVIFMVDRNYKFKKFELNKATLEKHKVSFLERVEKFMFDMA